MSVDAISANNIKMLENRLSNFPLNRQSVMNGPLSVSNPLKWQAAYAMLSYNTSTSAWSYVFYNEDFGPVHINGYDTPLEKEYGFQTGYNTDHGFWGAYVESGVGIPVTQGQASSNSNLYQINGTSAGGEFGFSGLSFWSNSKHPTSPGRGLSSHDTVVDLNAYVITSSHKNKRIAYTLKAGILRAVDRFLGVAHISLLGTLKQDLSAIVGGTTYGNMDYNSNTKKLVCLQYISDSAGTASYKLHVWDGIDFDINQSPAAAFADSNVAYNGGVNINVPNFTISDQEKYNAHPVITDTGTVYFTIKYTSDSFKLYSIPVNTVLFNTVATLVQSLTTTTSYSLANSIGYQAKHSGSRDGSTVALYTQYYCVHSGVKLFLINRISGLTMFYSVDDTGYGFMVLPHKDNGWAVYYAGNAYASNFQGGYIVKIFSPSTDNQWQTVNNGNVYLPYFPMPNTTNYPGLWQVADYFALQTERINPLTGKFKGFKNLFPTSLTGV